ncbi:OmpA family protein [Gammaproteobacteria bacterium]|nr:OmpA family protein [Gammaproteobacteria bacterium]
MLTAGSVYAADNREAAPGYAEDASSNVIKTGSGDCLRTGSWKESDATLVGCDGVVLNAPVEVIKGAPSGLVGAIVIPSAALFAFDKAELTEDGKAAIEEYRKQLRPELSEAYEGIIIGHTDSTGDANYNIGLSKRRAEAVSAYLVSTGVEAAKLREIGRGENDPIASNDTKEGQAENRRVEIVVVGEPRALDNIRFPSVALFPRRSAELTEQGKAVLDSNISDARVMLDRAVFIEVIGHTDDVGDDAYNQDLSEKRAAAVSQYLIDAGVDGSKIYAVGAGENSPIATNTTPEGRAENRRVEVLVLGRVR